MPARQPPAADDQVAAVRSFNRFYTRRIGALGEVLPGTGFTLPQARVLYEIAHRPSGAGAASASDLAQALGLDPGYLSRLIAALVRRGDLGRERAAGDARRLALRLTAQGARAMRKLEAGSNAQAGAMLAALPPSARGELVAALARAQALLAGEAGRVEAPIVLREARPGDFGWIVHRHGALYHAEFGWDTRFEALVAEIVAGMVRRFDPACERCWIAERDGRIVGTVSLVRKSARVAKLRLLIVEPEARGSGLGARLVEECERFARACGYRRIVLWTHANLVAARNIYRRQGYVCEASEPYRGFGHDLVSENWSKSLD